MKKTLAIVVLAITLLAVSALTGCIATDDEIEGTIINHSSSKMSLFFKNEATGLTMGQSVEGNAVGGTRLTAGTWNLRQTNAVTGTFIDETTFVVKANAVYRIDLYDSYLTAS